MKQATFTDEDQYMMPLTPEDRRWFFLDWCKANPELISAIEAHAIDMWNRGHKRISSKYLIEWARYEVPIRSVGIPFFDTSGKRHEYRICNTDTPALARWLKQRHPKMPIVLKHSKLDETTN